MFDCMQMHGRPHHDSRTTQLSSVHICGVMQVAGDANASGHVYPDQSLYPANSGPMMVKRLNQALQRADQIEFSEGKLKHDW